MIKSIKTIILFTLFAFRVSGNPISIEANAIDISNLPQEERTLFINISEMNFRNRPSVLPDDKLRILIKEKPGEISGRIIDSKGSLVAVVKLSDFKGKGYFIIDLSLLSISNDNNEVFQFQLKLKHEPDKILEFLLPSSDLEEIIADIIVNPIMIKCDQKSVVEFFGSIIGGRAPYSINWYVDDSKILNDTESLNLNKKNELPMITVDKQLSYKVKLEGTDACGREFDQTVIVNCNEAEKEKISVYLETGKNQLKRNRKRD